MSCFRGHRLEYQLDILMVKHLDLIKVSYLYIFTDSEVLGSTLGLDDRVTIGLDDGSDLGYSIGSFDGSDNGIFEGSLLGVSLGKMLELSWVHMMAFSMAIFMAFFRDQHWECHLDLKIVKRLALMKASHLAILLLKLFFYT